MVDAFFFFLCLIFEVKVKVQLHPTPHSKYRHWLETDNWQQAASASASKLRIPLKTTEIKVRNLCFALARWYPTSQCSFLPCAAYLLS